MDTLFISDLHLSSERPHKIALFKQFFNGPARSAKAVYILGDLFEHFWVGNDDRTPPVDEIITALKNCSLVNERIYIVRGNRDLMLGKSFTSLSGCRVLDDETVIQVDGQAVLIMHGDLLCTQDKAYQRFRRFLERPFIRWLYLTCPYPLRLFLSHGLRPALKTSSARKPPEIMDVEQITVEKLMRKHGVDELIHGHTHRPGFHDFKLNGQAARRIVLGDWYDTDSVLVCRQGEKRLMRVQAYIDGV